MNRNDHSPKGARRAVFTQGGKGGVGKTEVAKALAGWYRAIGLEPRLLDFDVENAKNGGFQGYYPEAVKLDIHKEGALDAFFSAFDSGTVIQR